MKKKQAIKCDVESCKHQNNEENVCELDEIKVGCSCDDEACSCDETACESFECNEDKENSSSDEDDDEEDDDDEEKEE